MVYIEAFFAVLPLLFSILIIAFAVSKSFRSLCLKAIYRLVDKIKNKNQIKVANNSKLNVCEKTFELQFPPEKPDSNYALKYSYDEVKLAKTADCNTDVCVVDAECGLYHEYKNEHDSKAVAVYYNDVKIGYFYKSKLQDMYIDFTDGDGLVTAIISKIEDGEIYVNLSFYKERDIIKELEEEHETKVFTLTNTSKRETQEMIELSSVGDVIYYNWDFDKEKYTSDIGCFPKSANSYLENNADAYVYEIEEDDDGKYVVSAIVQID